ncbi:hypothetical protein C8J57DRAFT_1048704 [Mycena rebaudengoi]|nr:hypothetical protein C8J57DRAFT_1048704 [Mycena rebaudengoi]
MAAKADVAQFPTCFNLAAEMKRKGIPPDITTYTTLLRALAHGGYAAQTLAVLEDMVNFGVHPNATCFNHIIHAHRTLTSPHLHLVLRKMEQLGVVPNAATYTLIITRFTAEDNLEMALQHLHTMKDHKLLPETTAAQAVIALAARQGHPRLAIDLAIWFEAQTVRKVENPIWLACLQSAAAELYAEGVIRCWYTLVADLAVSPDEGLCTLVLNTAARNGLPDLATDALRVLKVLEVPWMEHHLAPLFEAFCRAERFEDAFSTLVIMRQNNIEPTQHTAFPLIGIINGDPEILDKLRATLEQMRKEEKPVDISALNILVRASISAGQMSNALADYNSFKSFGLQPSRETFHHFIDGCISSSDVAYGELAFRQMVEGGTSPDHDVFEKMIMLHLKQETYDDAFLHLEQMQAAGFVPARHIYEALILKCASVGDARYSVALEEMREVGHRTRPDFMAEVARLNNLALAAAAEVVEQARVEALKNSGGLGLDGSARKFIETGGLSGLEVKGVSR